MHDPLFQALLNGVLRRDFCAIKELHHAFSVTFEKFIMLALMLIEKLVLMFFHDMLLKCKVSLHVYIDLTETFRKL